MTTHQMKSTHKEEEGYLRINYRFAIIAFLAFHFCSLCFVPDNLIVYMRLWSGMNDSKDDISAW
jgi:hypothetical protein